MLRTHTHMAEMIEHTNICSFELSSFGPTTDGMTAECPRAGV